MGIVRDFSFESIANIREIIRVNVDEEDEWGIVDWWKDTFCTDDLNIGDYLNNVSEYQSQMIDKYNIGSEKFDEILYRVHSVDNNYAQRYSALYERMVAFQNKILGIVSLLSPKAIAMNKEDYGNLAKAIDNQYNNTVESYKTRISECEESLPRLGDPSFGEKVLNFAGGLLTSVVLDTVEGMFYVPAVVAGALDPRFTIEDYTYLLHSMGEEADEWIVDNLVTDKESYYYGRVTGDCIIMIAGIAGMGNGLMTLVGGISLTEGGVILTLTGGGAVIGIPAIAVSVPVVAVGVLEMAGSASIAYSGYSNMNDHIQKINEINSSPDKPDIGDIKKTESTGVDKINNNLESRISVNEKLDKYLLNSEHPKGKSKADWFERALGFNRENASELANQIIFDSNTAKITQTTQYGVQYNQVISIKGANGRIIDVTFAWIKNNDGVIRLVTAIPTKK